MTSPGRFSVPLHRNAVVMEFGSKLTKLGFAGEAAPVSILPTIGQVAEGKKISLFDSGISSSLRTEAFRSFLKHVYTRVLLQNAKDRRAIVILNPFVSEKVEKAILDVLLIHFEVPAVAFVAPHMTVFPSLGTLQTGLVIDIGNTTKIIPVSMNTAIVGAWEALPYMGFGALVRYVSENLSRSLQVVQTTVNSDIDQDDAPAEPTAPSTSAEICQLLNLEEFTQSLLDRWIPCTILERAKKLRRDENYGETFKSFPDLRHQLTLGDKVHEVIISGRFLEQAMEIFFAPNYDGQTLPSAVLEVILRCPVDLRKPMMQNILVVGGLADVRNFIPRLNAELSQLVKEEPYATKLPNASFRFVSTEKIPPNVVAWRGCSILGHASYYPEAVWITREDLMLRGSGTSASQLLKEWCYIGKDRRLAR